MMTMLMCVRSVVVVIQEKVVSDLDEQDKKFRDLLRRSSANGLKVPDHVTNEYGLIRWLRDFSDDECMTGCEHDASIPGNSLYSVFCKKCKTYFDIDEYNRYLDVKEKRESEQKITELKARIARLETAIAEKILARITEADLLEAYDETPKQSLAKIQKEAVENFLLERPVEAIGNSPDWAIIFEDTDRPDEIIFDELTARHIFNERRNNWNCHLFKRVQSAAGMAFEEQLRKSVED